MGPGASLSTLITCVIYLISRIATYQHFPSMQVFFYLNPKKSRRDASVHLIKFLRQIRDKGFNIVSDVSLGLEVFTDVDLQDFK